MCLYLLLLLEHGRKKYMLNLNPALGLCQQTAKRHPIKPKPDKLTQ